MVAEISELKYCMTWKTNHIKQFKEDINGYSRNVIHVSMCDLRGKPGKDPKTA